MTSEELICIEDIDIKISPILMGKLATLVENFPPVAVEIREGYFNFIFIKNDEILLWALLEEHTSTQWFVSKHRISAPVAKLLLKAYHNVMI